MDLFFWIIAGLLIAAGAYMNWTNWKTYFSAKKAKAEFLSSHSDAKVEKVNASRIWLFLLMGIACLGLSVFILLVDNESLADSRYSQALVYFGLFVFSVSLLAEAMTESEVVYTPEGFMISDSYVRFKSVRAITVGKGFFKSSSLTLMGAEPVPTSTKLAAWLDAQWKEWQSTRKEERKSRKQRRAAARARKDGVSAAGDEQ